MLLGTLHPLFAVAERAGVMESLSTQNSQAGVKTLRPPAGQQGPWFRALQSCPAGEFGRRPDLSMDI